MVITGSNTQNPSGSTKIVKPAARPDERVSLAPLDPATALKGLLATKPPEGAND